MDDTTRRLVVLGGQDYFDKVKALLPLAYYPLSEGAGTTIIDYSGNGYNGTYTGVTWAAGIGDGRLAAYFDGTNDYSDIYSVGLSSAWNWDEFTVAIWYKVFAATVWTDSTRREVLSMSNVGSSRYVSFRRHTVDNQFILDNHSTTYTDSTASTGWVHIGSTCSEAANERKYYLGGSQVGTTVAYSTLDTGLNTTNNCIGSQSTVGGFKWNGYLAHCVFFTRPLSAAEMLVLATV